MFKLIFIFFITAHILGDFYFQSDKLAERKICCYKQVLLHSLIYLLVFIVCAVPFWSPPLLICTVILSLAHFVIDNIKFYYLLKRRRRSVIYIADQIMHIACMAAAALIFARMAGELKLLPFIAGFLSSVTNDPFKILGWTGLILVICKPSNITIGSIVERYKPENISEVGFAEKNKIGAVIGSLERIIISMLMGAGQYAAIGLVLTAKSVARFNKISEDKQFAEYYLFGTLLSTAFAIGAYFIFI